MAKAPQPFGSSGRGPQRFGLFGGGVPSFGGESRYFIKLPGVNQYINTGIMSLPEDEINISGLFSTSDQSQSMIFSLYTDDASEYLRLGVNGSGFLKIYSNGFTPGDGVTRIDDGILHRFDLNVNKSTGLISLDIDGEFEYSTTHSNVSKIASSYYLAIGAERTSTNPILTGFFDGIIANLRITGDNITSGGEPVDELFYPLDDSPDDFPVIRNSAVELGPEMWSYSVTLDGSVGRYQSLGGVDNGGVGEDTIHLAKISARGISQGSFRLRVGTGASSRISTDGDYVFILNSAGRTRLLLQQASEEGIIADSIDVSVKKAPGYGQFINGSVDAYGEFTQQENGWLGSGLSVPPWDSTNQLIEVSK